MAIVEFDGVGTDLLELPTTSVFTYVWSVAIGPFLLRVRTASLEFTNFCSSCDVEHKSIL